MFSSIDFKYAVRPILLKEMNDARKNKWLVGYATLLALLGVAVAYAGLGTSTMYSMQMFGRTTATLINLCLFLAPLVGVSLGASTISSERDQGTLDQLLAQPITRTELLIGKYCGLWLALFLATLAGFAPAGIMVVSFAGLTSFYSFLIFPMLAQLVISAMLAVGMAISVRSAGRAQSQTFAILIWFAFVLAYDLLLISSFAVTRLSAEVLAALVVFNPVDAGRVLSVLALEPDLYMLGAAGAYLVETLGTTGTAALLISSLALWAAVQLCVAIRMFRINCRQPRVDWRWRRNSTSSIVGPRQAAILQRIQL